MLEYLNSAAHLLPKGVSPSLGPDATGVGWVYEYLLQSRNHNLQQLRSIQDWYMRYGLTGVKGVAEVASIGGYVKQYQVVINPDRPLAYHITIAQINHQAVARYRLTVGDVQDIIQSAIGGMNLTQTVEGLARYPVNIRYEQGFRDSLSKLRRVLVPLPSGKHIPKSLVVAKISIHKGSPGIKSENARRTAWIYIDIKGVDIGTYVKRAQSAVREKVKMPAGYSLV